MTYNDPKTTRPVTTSRGSGRTIWIVVGVIVLALVLAWALGMFGGADDAITTTGETPAVEAPATGTDPAAPATPAPAN